MRGRASSLTFLPDRKIVKGFAVGGIGDFEVDGGVEVGGVSQVSGKHGECMLRGLPTFFDGLESVDGKGMAQAMGSRSIEEDIAEFFSGLGDPHLFYGLVEEKSDLWTT